MEKENSFSLMVKNSSEDISQEKVIKLILQNLIEKYSLEKIINDMVALSKENVNSLSSISYKSRIVFFRTNSTKISFIRYIELDHQLFKKLERVLIWHIK